MHLKNAFLKAAIKKNQAQACQNNSKATLDFSP